MQAYPEVTTLINHLTNYQKNPELYKLIYKLGHGHSFLGMQNLTLSHYSTAFDNYYPEIFQQPLEVIDYYYDEAINSNPEDHDTGAYAPRNILYRIHWIQKQRTFVIQFLNAYLDLTRSHQQDLYNDIQNDEQSDTTYKSIEKVLEFIWNSMD